MNAHAPIAPQIIHLPVDDLVPYENNPRDNESAIDAVKQSIIEFGFLVPIVVDENNVIVAGHTRYAAIQRLLAEQPENAAAYSQVPCVVAGHLNEAQINAFRLIDNKTSELATWNFDLLAGEISALYDSGISLTDFGWSQEEIDCLNSVVSADCLVDSEAAALVEEGAQAAGHVPRNRALTKDGTGVRITFGELGFFVDLVDYKVWFDELMRVNEYDPRAVVEHIAESMGLLQAKLKRDERVRSGEVSPEAEEALQPVAQTEEREEALAQ